MSSRWGRADAQAFDDAWSGGAASDDIAVLVRTAEHLRASADADLRPAFRTQLREHLMLEAATVLVEPGTDDRPAEAPAPPRRPVRRRLAGLVAVLVATVGAVGLVTSSASAVPGDMLYPVKRGVESVELTFHRNDVSRGDFRLSLATKRLAEATALADRGSSDSQAALMRALDDFSEQALAGSDALFDDFASRRDQSSIGLVTDFAARSGTQLSELSADLPDSADTAFRTASTTIDGLVEQASGLCGECVVADISALVRAVESRSPSKTTDEPAAAGDSSPREEPSASGSGGSSAEEPIQAPATAAPSGQPTADPAPSGAPTPAPKPSPTRAPSLADVTDPLLGALLGDDDQVGLVPGLLGGLLGNSR